MEETKIQGDDIYDVSTVHRCIESRIKDIVTFYVFWTLLEKFVDLISSTAGIVGKQLLYVDKIKLV